MADGTLIKKTSASIPHCRTRENRRASFWRGAFFRYNHVDKEALACAQKRFRNLTVEQCWLPTRSVGRSSRGAFAAMKIVAAAQAER